MMGAQFQEHGCSPLAKGPGPFATGGTRKALGIKLLGVTQTPLGAVDSQQTQALIEALRMLVATGQRGEDEFEEFDKPSPGEPGAALLS